MVRVVEDNEDIICDKCGSKLSYYIGEDTFHYISIEERDGKIKSKLIELIECPVCHKNVKIN